MPQHEHVNALRRLHFRITSEIHWTFNAHFAGTFPDCFAALEMLRQLTQTRLTAIQDPIHADSMTRLHRAIDGIDVAAIQRHGMAPCGCTVRARCHRHEQAIHEINRRWKERNRR